MPSTTILTIVGPTSAGKSAYAVERALEHGGEIISVDSRQVYRGFVIGTGQPTATEQRGIPHHLVNVLDPSLRITAGHYARLVYEKIAEITSRGKAPILCGGSGLYVRAVRLGLAALGASDSRLRTRILARIEEEGAEAVLAAFARVDPAHAASLHPQNIQRLARALEILETTGKPPSEIYGWCRVDGGSYRETPAITIAGVGQVTFDLVGLRRPRVELNERIDRRVVDMVNRGWVEEVRGLLAPSGAGLAAGVSPSAHPMQSVGYRQLVQVLAGELSLEEAVPLIQLRTRQFARRQVTWFRKEPVSWVRPQ